MGIFDELGMGDELRSITEEENKFKPQELNEANARPSSTGACGKRAAKKSQEQSCSPRFLDMMRKMKSK